MKKFLVLMALVSIFNTTTILASGDDSGDDGDIDVEVCHFSNGALLEKV